MTAPPTPVYTLEGADRFYRTLIEGMSEGVLTLNSAGTILYANQRFAELLAAPLDDVIGTAFDAWVAPEGQRMLAPLLDASLRGRRYAEVTLLARSGTRPVVKLSMSDLALDGTLPGFALIITDITERKLGDAQLASDRKTRRAMLSVIEDQERTARSLREVQDRLDGILSSIDQVIWSADAATHEVLYLNTATQTLFGRPLQEFFDQPQLWLTTIHPDDKDRALATDRQVREHGQGSIEYRILRPDGSVRWVSNQMRLTRNDRGQAVRLDGVMSDITERKQAEAALVESEQQFRGIVEQSIAGCYVIQDGKFAYANPRYAEILGYESPDELIGRDALSLVPESERPRVAENFRRRLSGEVKSVNYNTLILRKDGSTIVVGAHGTLASYRGRPAIIGLMQDISEKKRAEEQIQRYVVQLQGAFMRSVEVAMNLSEMRDPYTAGHERRVAEIAVAIGAEMGLEADRIEGLRVAGYLHDVGKISLPAEILSKPGKLTPIELELIKSHALTGFEVLKNVEFPWPVAQVALQHHERIDGSGYPNRLKGDAILLESRIMAVADVVEAMASHRPYRAGLGIDRALAEIERGRGTAYDPQVSDACLRLFREKQYSIPV